MPRETVDGVTLNYEIEGPDGAPVLTLAHGQAFDLSSWDALVPAFHDRYRVLRLDLRGHGGSGLGDVADLRMMHLAADLLSLLDALGIAKTHYVGRDLYTIVTQIRMC